MNVVISSIVMAFDSDFFIRSSATTGSVPGLNKYHLAFAEVS